MFFSEIGLLADVVQDSVADWLQVLFSTVTRYILPGKGENRRPWEVNMRLQSLVIVLLLSAAAILSQTTTSQEISGLVQDTSGAVVPSATVTVKNTLTGLTRTTLSNEARLYLVSNLPIGTYDISAEAPGSRSS
jgi:hypothetical protein